MPNGFLRVQVTSALQSRSVNEAMIRVYKDNNHEIIYETFTISNNMGVTPYLALAAPDINLSLDSHNQFTPYETYNVEIRCNAYETLEIIGVQIFAQQKTNLPINLVPIETLDQKIIQRSISMIPTHQLFINEQRHNDHVHPTVPSIKSTIRIPKRIIVHLGIPSSSAENLNVDFIDYIKNVACSELYPTWEKEAIKANIYCYISLTLNRIYSDWYPSKGYQFNITGAVSYDQSFVKNRNIFETISNIVDEIFNEYIQKDNDSLPYYAEYCDGKINHCSGFKKWDSQYLAAIGYDYFKILKHFYGEHIQIVTTNDIQDNEHSYPGTPLRIHMSGIDVTIIQEKLQLLASNYPQLKTTLSDGFYDHEMERVIKLFQAQFCLSIDGVVGKQTWYRIASIAHIIKHVNKLHYLLKTNDFILIDKTLQLYDNGIQVNTLQLYLNIISLNDPCIIEIPEIDGIFLNKTYLSVISFQRKYNLNKNGIVDINTRNKIVTVVNQYKNNLLNIDPILPYPKITFTLGMTYESILHLQQALNNISSIYVEVPISITDGIYNKTTINAIAIIQSIINMEVTSILNEATWNAIFTINNEIINGDTPSLGLPQYPSIRKEATITTKDVLLIQQRLETIAEHYPLIPVINKTGSLEKQTKKAISAFQSLLGFRSNGVLDFKTWNKINEMYQQLIQVKKGI